VASKGLAPINARQDAFHIDYPRGFSCKAAPRFCQRGVSLLEGNDRPFLVLAVGVLGAASPCNQCPSLTHGQCRLHTQASLSCQ